MSLSQKEADSLFKMEKQREFNVEYEFPQLGGKTLVPLMSLDEREKFIFEIERGRINRLRIKYQTMARKVFILVRLELDGPTHQNPDGEEVPTPHIHMYKEGFGDKWAYPISKQSFTNIEDPVQSLKDFMNYCNITHRPVIKMGLFV